MKAKKFFIWKLPEEEGERRKIGILFEIMSVLFYIVFNASFLLRSGLLTDIMLVVSLILTIVFWQYGRTLNPWNGY